MSQRARAVAGVGIVAAVLGSGAAYLLAVHRPAQALAAARAEIAAWELRWADARACIVGRVAASPSLEEAIAVHRLAGPIADRGTCAKVIGTLTRGAGEASELDPVERAWPEIDRAAGALALAYVAEATSDRSLAVAVADVDTAHAALRDAAALPPLARATLTPLARATLTPLVVGGAPLTGLERVAVTNGSLVAVGRAGDTRALIVHAPGRPTMLIASGRAMRSVPDLEWGLERADDALRGGTLDERGQITTLHTWPRASAALAVGNARAGHVVYEADGALTFVRLLDHAARPGLIRAIDSHDSDVDPSGRAVVVWSAGGKLGAATLSPATDARMHDLGAGALERVDGACHTAEAAWASSTAAVFAIASSGVQHVRLPGRATVVGCTADAAILRMRGTTRFAICAAASTIACTDVELATAPPGVVPAVVDGDLVGVWAEGQILGVWSAHAATRHVALDRPFVPRQAIANGSEIAVLGRTPTGIAMVRVPAR